VDLLKCGHLNESNLQVLSFSNVCYATYKVVLTFDSVDEILKCDHSNERY